MSKSYRARRRETFIGRARFRSTLFFISISRRGAPYVRPGRFVAVLPKRPKIKPRHRYVTPPSHRAAR